VKKKVDPKI